MDSILQQLFYGEIYPSEQYCPRSKAYRSAAAAYRTRCVAFEQELQRLDSSLPMRLQEILELHTSCLSFEITEMFISGFRLGARMMLEILDDSKK